MSERKEVVTLTMNEAEFLGVVTCAKCGNPPRMHPRYVKNRRAPCPGSTYKFIVGKEVNA